MNTVRLNITLPSAVNDDITRYAEELNEKNSLGIVHSAKKNIDN